MGQHTELMAQEWKIAREDQDRLAFESHKKAAEAYRSGYMDDLIVPFAGVFRDNNLREDISLEQAGQPQAGLRQGARHADRRQLDAAHRRRRRRAAGLARNGRRAAGCRCRPT